MKQQASSIPIGRIKSLR